MSEMIPKKLHFIFGLSRDFGGKPFQFFHWAAIRSAQVNNPDYETHFWFSHKPDNYFFEDLESSLVLHKIEAPNEVFGRPIPHVAHKTDLLRLFVLQEHGGVYQDLDTFTVRSFDSLLDHSFVMAREMVENKTVGLCNAVILSEPNHPFIANWIERFRHFRSVGRDQFWNESAVVWPWLIYSENPCGATVLEPESFLIPDWTRQGLEDLLINTEVFPDAFTHHLWESFSWHALCRHNERNSGTSQSTYSNLLKSHLSQAMRRLADRRAALVREMLTEESVILNMGYRTRFQAEFINADCNAETGMDFVVDFERERWPFVDSTFSFVFVSRLLERIGTVEHFFKELYRTARNGAVVEISLPHPRHDFFLRNPNHQRVWIAESFEHLDLDKCKGWFFEGDMRELLAMEWMVDFKILSADYRVPHRDPAQSVASLLQFDPQNLGAAMQYLNNTIGDIRVRLQCRKG
jgi:SAM-dependent methyltransferase